MFSKTEIPGGLIQTTFPKRITCNSPGIPNNEFY
jgi:hypothetical protein